MSDFDNYSRVNKFEKRRKNTKSLSVFLVVGGILVVVLIGILIFGGGDTAEQPADEQEGQAAEQNGQDGNNEGEATTGSEEESETESNSMEENDRASDNSTGTEEDSGEESNSDSDAEAEQVEPSDDNVIEAYTKDWQPVGTEQSEPHTINYDEGSQDRREMQKAAAIATGLDKESMIMWWIDQYEDQKVVNTVSNASNTEYYRVYMTWIENQGWKPTKVEELKENDQAWRFE